jgi:hypothetical protein
MIMTGDLPFYNYLGEIEHIPGYPLSFGDWSLSTTDSVSPEQQSLLDGVSRVLRKLPTESRIRAQDLNLVGI